MGIPFRRLICASNSNNAVTQFINTGTYDIRSVQLQRTASPAIDILVSSNLERYLYHTCGSTDLVRKWFQQLEQDKYFTIDESVSINYHDCTIPVNDKCFQKLEQLGQMLYC